MTINNSAVAAFLEKWQDILRLRDWDIKYTPVEKEWRKTGDIKIDMHDRTAVLLINTFNPKQTNLEELIIHELLHLKLFAWDQLTEELISAMFDGEHSQGRELVWSQFMDILEPTVQDLTKAYLSLGGVDKTLSFGRLEKEIQDEIGE
jgi:hypothetical protein